MDKFIQKNLFYSSKRLSKVNKSLHNQISIRSASYFVRNSLILNELRTYFKAVWATKPTPFSIILVS